MRSVAPAETVDKVHFRDVELSRGGVPPVAFPHRVGIETRCRPGYGQRGATRTLDDPCCIFQMTLQGEGVFEDDRGVHPLPQGAAFLCESHDPRIAYRYPEAGIQPWEFVYMSFGGEGVTRMVRDFGEQETRVLHLDPSQSAIKHLIRMAATGGSTLFLERPDALRLVLEILAVALPSHVEGSVPAAEVRVKQVQTRIEELMEQGRVDLGQLSAEVGMSPSALCRFYRDQTGESPYQYIRRKQMLVACQWLLESEWTIKEVAERLGFSSASNFIRSFKQIIGLTPTEVISEGVMPRV